MNHLKDKPKRRDPMPLEEHCSHHKEQQIPVEYEGWFDGPVEIYCMECEKRRIVDEPQITLHSQYKRYHPDYGIYDFKSREWWVTSRLGDVARAKAEDFIRDYVYTNPPHDEDERRETH